MSIKKAYKASAVLIFLFFTASLFPWISGKMFNWWERHDVDSRITLNSYPEDYFIVEEILNSDKESKALYIPASYNGTVQTTDKYKFPYGYRDTFALYSPIPGILSDSDRDIGTNDVIKQIISESKIDLLGAAKKVNAKYIVIRKDLDLTGYEESLGKIYNEKSNGSVKYSKIYSGGNIDLFELSSVLPDIYIPENMVCEDYIVANVASGSSTLFSKDKLNQSKCPFSNYIKDNKTQISYKKDDQSEYTVKLSNVTGPTPFVFLESFDEYWRINNSVNSTRHFKVNGYTNGWIIDPKEICEEKQSLCSTNKDGSFEIIFYINFWPQKIFNIGKVISLSTIIVLFSLMLIEIFRRKKVKYHNK